MKKQKKISLLEKKLEKTEEELIDTKKKCKININLEKRFKKRIN